MAMVNVDLSEYDMLRETKNKAEQQVKELKAEIEEYKKNARVIVTTKKCFRTLDAQKVADIATRNYIRSNSFINPLYLSYLTIDEREAKKESNLKYAIESAIRECDVADAYTPFSTSLDRYDSSTEIKGFEDVRLKVEETLKAEYSKELQSKQMELDSSIAKYKEKYDNACDEARKVFEDKLSLAKEELSIDLLSKETSLKKATTKISNLIDELDSTKEEVKRLQELVNHTENYKASARSFELENIKLKKELEVYQHNIKILEAKVDNKPWYKRLF